MNRRRFIRDALQFGSASALLSSAGLLWSERASADTDWGALPTDPQYWPASLARPNYKILEIHLSGGLSPYETFHVDTSLSASDRWFNLATQVGAVDWSGCGLPGTFTSTSTQAFSGSISLGPATNPLWPFKDFMRVVVLHHELEPHEAAIPFSLTGLALGNPKGAGLGTAIEHRNNRAISGKTTPNSYVLIPGNLRIDEDSFLGFHSAGLHGGAFRPLVLRLPEVVGRDEAFLDSLERASITPVQNDLLRQYRAQYADRLRHHASAASLTRSSEYLAYSSALDTLLDAPNLRSVLDTALASSAADTSCLDGPVTTNLTRAALQTAAKLLTLDPAMGGARYVGLADGGIRSTTGGGYDVHGSGEYPRMFTNLWNCLSNLAALVHRPTTPAAVDPNKINLNDTLIVLNTEFGRTPEIGRSGARDHFPSGYVNVLIGGPITTKGVAGRFNSDGSADPSVSFTATDVRAALMMAAGIDPFAPETFGVGDVSPTIRSLGFGTEEDCARALREQLLGVV